MEEDKHISKLRKMKSFSHTPTLGLFLVIILQCPMGGTAIVLGNETDHIALLAIKSNLVDHSGGVLSSWNHSIQHCSWEGVTCGRKHRRVTVLDLSSRGLSGTISPFIGNMSFLEELSLYNNSLYGRIPLEVSHLFRLHILDIDNNTIAGNIPANLSSCIELQFLSVQFNKLGGELPRGLGALPELKGLYMSRNSFTGSLFDAIGNLTSLQVISSLMNAFTGVIPSDSIARMRNLRIFNVGENAFSGPLPQSIFNLSYLQKLEIDGNQLEGSLPPDIGFQLPQLRMLNIFQNQMTGPIPTSISNLTSLEYLSLGFNNFTGMMQVDFGRLQSLYEVEFSANHLFGDLSFIDTLVNCSNLVNLGFAYNHFTGELPKALANLSNLAGLVLHQNQLRGRIPMAITNFVNLEMLAMDFNKFTGTIPHDIGKLQNLGYAGFSFNSLSGRIPNSFNNLSHLTRLLLGGNKFQGRIPPELGNCHSLLYLDLSHNEFNGTLPNEIFGGSAKFIEVNLSRNNIGGSLPLISQQTNLIRLDVSKNKLAGEVPNGLGKCPTLQYLNMEGNSFHGDIPPSFSSLESLQTLDLSHNNLSGPVPKYFSKFPLVNLVLSYNNFEGRVPTNGVFANASAISLVGNTKICGGIPELHLPICTEKEGKKRRMPLTLKLTVSLICALVVGVAMGVWMYLTCHKPKRKSVDTCLPISDAFLKVSYNMLLKATDGFSSENLLGTGAFGSVFKGFLEPYGRTVAVKVLNLQHKGASKSFIAECKALRNIRHRNIVGILSACSSTDFQGNDFKALVYEFMPNGSLERWLHYVGNLSLGQRVDIAIDVGCALDYLHNGCEFPMRHCDLKPSNILLDDDMVAHVGDFGLAKFLFQHQNLTQSSSMGIRGTVGYVAPEYGLQGEASTDGDIYSFGILLIELVTRNRPTDNMFKEGFDLHIYAKEALPDHVLKIVDPVLIENESEEIQERRSIKATLEQRVECVVAVVNIGVACSNPSPRDRMKITDAIRELQQARDIISNARHKRT